MKCGAASVSVSARKEKWTPRMSERAQAREDRRFALGEMEMEMAMKSVTKYV